MPYLNENIQRDLSQLDTAHWVVSLDTDYIYLEEPDWSEQSGAYHEPPLARMERQKQQASKNQISNHVAAIENKLGILAAWEKHREKEKEKNVKIIGAWETTYIHVHNKAVPDQKVWQLAAEAKKEKQKEILVGSEKSKVVKKVNNKKDPRKMEKQLMQSVQVTTIDKTIDTAKTRDHQQHRELSGITEPVAASVKKDRKGVKENEQKGKNKDWDDEYLTVAFMTLAARIHYEMLMMESVDDDWEHDLTFMVALRFSATVRQMGSGSALFTVSQELVIKGTLV